MNRRDVLFSAALAWAQPARAQPIELDPKRLQALNVKVDAVEYKGRKAVRLTDASPAATDGTRLALIPGVEFGDGTIEVELTGDAVPGAPATVRGFTGVAFRVQAEGSKYEAFYLRTKNARSEDQAQRNHSAQYISHPEFPWQRLRKEFPEKYESYVDLVPGEWIQVRIEVQGQKARLFVHGNEQPTLVVSDVKGGPAKGGVALWIGPGVVAHFANLRVK
jgi:hypothetical protein